MLLTDLAVNGTELCVLDTGPGATGETILFIHGLLFDHCQFAPQIAAMRADYRCIAYDLRGQGRSADHDGPKIDIELLYDDMVALIDHLGLGPIHVVGLSMGGFIALRLAARRPQQVRSLALISTTADPEPAANKSRYRLLAAVARWISPRLVIGPVMRRMFGRTVLRSPARAAEVVAWQIGLRRLRPTIWRAVNGVIEREDAVEDARQAHQPALVMVGDEDRATPPGAAERLVGLMANARLLLIPAAGHTPTLERPNLTTDELCRFFGDLKDKAA